MSGELRRRDLEQVAGYIADDQLSGMRVKLRTQFPKRLRRRDENELVEGLLIRSGVDELGDAGREELLLMGLRIGARLHCMAAAGIECPPRRVALQVAGESMHGRLIELVIKR